MLVCLVEESCEVPHWHFPQCKNSTFSLWLQVPRSWPTRQRCGMSPARCRMSTRSWMCRPSRYTETWSLWPSRNEVWHFACQLLSVPIWLSSIFSIFNSEIKSQFPLSFKYQCDKLYLYCIQRHLSECVNLCICSYCVYSVCSMPVKNKRSRAKSATRLRRWRGWRPKRELKRWCHLHPAQVTSYLHWRPQI